jgi:hypothetical protein
VCSRRTGAIYTINATFGTQVCLSQAIGLCEILRVKLEFVQFDMGVKGFWTMLCINNNAKSESFMVLRT